MTRKTRESARKIEEILRRRHHPLADLVQGVLDVSSLPSDVRMVIVDELGAEFCEHGLLPSSQPNAYGLLLEDLTDACRPDDPT